MNQGIDRGLLLEGRGQRATPGNVSGEQNERQKMKRKLTVKEFGGGYRRGTPASTIRLKGQWLRRLGFEPGAAVELTAVSPGVLEIRLLAARPGDPVFHLAAMRLDHALEVAGRAQVTK